MEVSTGEFMLFNYVQVNMVQLKHSKSFHIQNVSLGPLRQNFFFFFCPSYAMYINLYIHRLHCTTSLFFPILSRFHHIQLRGEIQMVKLFQQSPLTTF